MHYIRILPEDRVIVDLNQAVRFECPQARELAGKVFVEIDAVLLLDCREFDVAAAHQRLDDIAAYAVVAGECEAACDRELMAVDALVVFAQRLHVLGVRVADLADRAYAQADQVAVRLRGVALEIAMQLALDQCLRKRIFWQRKMIHADVHIAGGRKAFDGQAQ